MNNLIINILIFSIPCWITNMSFQFIWIYVFKLPDTNKFKKITLSNPDFIFIDNKPFFGGLKMLNYLPILFLPFIFNLFDDKFTYYLIICTTVAVGDTLGSVVKRRLGFSSGRFLPFIDHGDYIITTGIVFLSLNYISFEVFIYSLILTYVLHPIACFIGYKLKIKKQPL